MTNEQSNSTIHPVDYIKKRVGSEAAYTLVPLKGRLPRTLKIQEAQHAKFLLATSFVKSLKHLLFITYRYTCPKLSYYSCAMKHVLQWVSGVPPHLTINYSQILVASGSRFNTDKAVAKPVGDI